MIDSLQRTQQIIYVEMNLFKFTAEVAGVVYIRDGSELALNSLFIPTLNDDMMAFTRSAGSRIKQGIIIAVYLN